MKEIDEILQSGMLSGFRGKEMPLIGDKKWDTLYHSKIWLSCPDCGKTRWVRVPSKNKPPSGLCVKCCLKKRNKPLGESQSWKGGRMIDRDGYILRYVNVGYPYFEMAKQNSYIMEHRLVMAEYLGRSLQSWEIVHHKNGIKDDNRIENLYLTTRRDHKLGFGEAYTEGYDAGYKQGVKDAKSVFV